MTMPAMQDRPDQPNKAVKDQEPALTLCRDLYGGTDTVKAKANVYLPRYPAELAPNYEARVARLVLFNGFERSVTGLTGMVCRRDPELGDDVPDRLRADWENIDLAGTHADVFIRERIADALVDGHVGILVDFPPVGRVLGQVEEAEMRVRPYWVPIRKSQIVSFRTRSLNGRLVLDQLVLKFCYTEPVGEYAERGVEEYRVYRHGVPVTFQVWLKRDGDQEPVFDRGGIIVNQDEIPFALIYGPRREAPLVSKPPLQDLAYRNISHLQVESDYLNSLHMAGSPVPVMIGDQVGDDAQGRSGPSWMIRLPVGGDFKYAEHTGQALGAFRQALEDIKAEMAVLGLAMLQRDFRAAETAEAKRMDKSASDSALAVLARNAQDAIEQAMMYHARYLGEADGGSVVINQDFDDLSLDAEMIARLSDLVTRGQLSLETMWLKLMEGEVLPDEFDPEEEADRIRNGILPAPPVPPEPAGEPPAEPAA